MDNQEVGVKGTWFESGDDVEHMFYGPMDMKWFMDKMYRDAMSGLFLIQSEDSQESYFFDTQSCTLAVLKAIELSKTKNVFFSIGLFNDDLLNRNIDNISPDNIILVPGLWLNINVLCSLNKEKRLPTQKEAFIFLKSQSMKPDFIVDVGSELQAYWIFKNPFIIDSAAEHKQIVKLSYDFQQKIINDARRLGWDVNDTSSLSNLQRLPGTWNHAFNPPKPIKLMEYAHL